ncbi:MAG TPA: putative 2OG-Fe(II) oxygenase [Gammaproteobacteria bacterium]|nr:putative 2OG-Fe(II) oxygenase [Gammaproteobacteria bacterium]
MSEFDHAFANARALLLHRRYEEAERAYEAAVALEPTNLDGQFMLAKLRYMRGDPRFARDLAATAARNRDNPALQQQFASVLRLTGDLAGAELLLRDLIARHGAIPAYRSVLASVLHEMNRLDEARTEALAAANAQPDNLHFQETFVSILLSLGQAETALPLVREIRRHVPGEHIWIAHEATAARLIGDAAYGELYDYDRFVRAYDLEPPPGWRTAAEFNAELAARLNQRHELLRQPFDQSMRAGTQTIGSLCDDEDPVIQAALRAFLAPIAEYRADLGAGGPHPLLSGNYGDARLSTCWSVRLGQEGHHVNHIHPDGWLSSAYYVTVPEETAEATTRFGWIQFGEPRTPVPGAGPAHDVQPRVGRLVLFPSYMWHGTTAIHGPNARMTMAFDVVMAR